MQYNFSVSCQLSQSNMLLPLLPLLALIPGCLAYLPAPDSCCSHVEVKGGQFDFPVEGRYALDTYNGDQVLLKDDFWGITIIHYTNNRFVIERMGRGETYLSGPTEEECPENVAFEGSFGLVEVSCTLALPWWTILILSLAGAAVLLIALCCLCSQYVCSCRRKREAGGAWRGCP